MRDRRARTAWIGLILALPILMTCLDRRATARDSAPLVALTELVLVAGLLTAARERASLKASRASEAADRPQPVAQPAALAPESAPAVR